jgi:transcriptional regulator with XRE-family HTH domain
MAKINVDTRSGALWELLKKKGMTQVDAHQKTGVDRKTLSKINRGGPVKLEKLQRVANKLEVPVEFLQPPAAEVTVDGDVPEPNTILLCKLDVARLFELLSGTERVEWKLNAHVKDEEARRFLEDFETAVENFRKQHALISHSETDNLSLRAQLDRLKTQDDVAAHLERLAVLRLALFGADYLFWDCDSEHGKYKSFVNYYSSRIVLLSVEPGGTQSRRTPVFQGKLPPRFDHLNAPDITIYVNGEELPKLDDSNIPSLRTLDDRAAPGASQGESDFAPPEVRKDEGL